MNRTIFDVFPFFNELDLLEVRLELLSPYVDFFVVSESTVTFTGLPKPLYFHENRDRFKRFHDKIIHNVVRDTPDDYRNFVPLHAYFTDWDTSYSHKSGGVPLRGLSLAFQREVYQRDSAINGLLGKACDDDIILISDLDEIPNPAQLIDARNRFVSGEIYNFSMKWLMYSVNVLCDREWFGTRACRFGDLRGRSLDLMRYHLEDRKQQPGPIVEEGGWHLSFLGGQAAVKYKLNAYDYQGRRTKFLLRLLDKFFQGRIQRKIRNNEDIFNTGRVFRTVALEEIYPEEMVSLLLKFPHHIKPPTAP